LHVRCFLIWGHEKARRLGASVKTAIALIVLGVVGGVVPTGLAGIPYATFIVACTFGALLLLLAACVIGASFARLSRPPATAPQALRRAASTRATRDVAATLIEEANQAVDRAAGRLREAEAAVAALRETMQRTA
jgi:hypothetical protein